MRLLDVGCGWGGMVMHAAKHYGVKALGVTLSRKQAEWAQKAIAEAGLTDLAEVRHLDYRDVTETGFDAVSSIGLTEHIGEAQLAVVLPVPVRQAAAGRAAAQPLHHPARQPQADAGQGLHQPLRLPRRRAASAPGHIIVGMHDTGFEVRHEENLREHYAMTLAGWCDNLDDHWDEAVAGGRARNGPGCGGSTWPARGWASSATTSSCTRCSA